MVVKFDEVVGESAGLETFEIRVEDGVVRIERKPDIEFETFESNRSYAVIKTEDQTSDDGKYHVHIRSGKDVSEQEQKLAEEVGLAIYNQLNQKPTVYRDREGEESARFLKYFDQERDDQHETEIIKHPQQKSGRSKLCWIPCVIFEVIKFFLILTTFRAVQKGLINRHIPSIFQRELPAYAAVDTLLYILYDLAPAPLQENLPKPSPLEKQYDLEFVILTGLLLWIAICLVDCTRRLFINCKSGGLIGKMVVCCGMIVCLVAFDRGCAPKCKEVSIVLSLIVWAMTLFL